MPASGPVYQPTTVTYEQQSDWTPISNLSQSLFRNGSVRTKCIQWVLLILGLITLAAGLVMIIEGSVDLYDTKQHGTEVGETPDSEAESASDLVIVVGGVVLVLLCIFFFGLYAHMVWRRKGCPCFPSKEQRLARQLDNQVGNGQVRSELLLFEVVLSNVVLKKLYVIK
jgi:formate hydrogenlyase subunit 3/multisubunit Na+/H+ antiporter MnhD subunit